VSDGLHDTLQPLVTPLLPDTGSYDDVFDELEVLLAILAVDSKRQADLVGQYQHGGWGGAFTWRRRWDPVPFEQQVWQARRAPLLAAGAFGSDAQRAEDAFTAFTKLAADARRSR
jgi:hypothetical protein